MCLQPFYRTLADSVKAYVQVEQERDNLRTDLERLSRKLIVLLFLNFFLQCLALSIMNYMRSATSGEKTSAESHVKELEEALAAQCAESKKELDAAKDSAAGRERVYAEQLAELAREVGGE